MGNENRTAAPSGAFRTGDGLINIAANKQEHFEAVARVAGAPELIDDPRFKDREDRKTNRYALKEILEKALAARSAGEWETLLNDAEVPAGRVLSVPQALAEPQVVERGFLRRFERVAGVGRDIAVVNSGFRLAGEPPTELAPPPTLGQHSDEILGELGLDAGEIAALRKEGAI
jgi:formyl-CoA transferase